ncbi:MAG: HAMP domain-containing protein [Methylovirgula sp.]|uniref:sensor histidine kinase n=1 Tax=Methylovirgula sp. TaxID=1978224 RepID=UPI003075F46D
MPLRLLLVRSIALIFLATLALSTLLVFWRAYEKVEADMTASLAAAQRAVANVADETDGITQPGWRLQHIVANFNGDRNVRATLQTADNSLVHSILAPPARPVPSFLYKLLAGTPLVATVDLPSALKSSGTLRLETDAHNDILGLWDDAKNLLFLLALFAATCLLVLYFMLGRALRPLEELTRGFARIGNGDYRARVPVFAPRELAKLSAGFNDMAVRLSEMEHRNHRLHEQLETVQEEERIELARNLHDDISPLLFSADVDAMTIRELAQTKDFPAIVDRAHAIRGAVAEMKRNVKAILGQLRPSGLHALGLASAVENLVSYWKSRRPEITFSVKAPDKTWGPRVDGALYSIIRESLNNAVKHSRPSRIEVLIEETYDGGFLVARVSDNGGGFDANNASGGFGLIGMKERATLLGGTLTVDNRSDRLGVVVTTRLPLPSDEDLEFAQGMAAQ